jgi:hypothetical protein
VEAYYAKPPSLVFFRMFHRRTRGDAHDAALSPLF